MVRYVWGCEMKPAQITRSQLSIRDLKNKGALIFFFLLINAKIEPFQYFIEC